ncbi:MAG TPA: YeeE/YedE thiosulfate transporter family protein [Solirubrobacter sp.]|nr:YeeE/YedE thiosulfate transporter family protein [Solirubrobacter sp.]
MHQQLAWYIGGPVLGLCVIALRWLLDERLGATGAWSDVIERTADRSFAFGTRGWLLLGFIAGGLVFGLFGASIEGYGWLTETFSGWVVVGVLVVSGALIGVGAKAAGGCTSGNGLCGSAILSPASLVATGTFFGTAILVSFVTEALL